jgi:hypothetical protein
MVGAVTGTPGTLPTNHSTTLNGLTRTIVGTGTENGVDYIDLQFSGTATGAALTYSFETSSQIVAASGQAWTNSMWIKQIADAGGNRPAARVTIYEFNSGGTYLAEGSAIATLTSSLTRFPFTRTLANASTARVQPLIQFVLVSGTTYNFTLRIGLPQMELGSVATSEIPTTAAAVTRNADVITLSGAVSGCIGQTEGTIYAEVDLRASASSSARRIVNMRVDGSNLLSLEISTAGTSVDFSAVSGGSSVTATASGITTGIYKIAVGYNSAASGTVLYVNGTLRDTKTIAIPNLSAAVFGLGVRGDGAAATQFNDRIRSAALYTTRLTNAELAALTT